MSWFDDILSAAGSALGGIDYGSLAGNLAVPAATYGIQQLFPDFFENQRDMAGYQGEIPKYTMQREQVPGAYDLDRRPGGSGRRYVTDRQYVPEGGIQAALSADELAEANTLAAARPAARPLQRQRSALKSYRSAEPDPIPEQFRSGGIATMAQGRYLNGATDGMADKVPANIDGTQEARLSDGEFVIPADVVGHLGNGNSNSGAEQLYSMMDRVRKARTGNTQQGKQINSSNMLPA